MFQLFLVFLKINCLSTSGPASIGLTRQEVVGKWVTEKQFEEAVAFATALPGSDALQLALYTGYKAYGVFGALLCLLGAILPPTCIILSIVWFLNKWVSQAIVSKFIGGMTPVLATLLIVSGLTFFNSYNSYLGTLFLVVFTLMSMYYNIPIIFVLLTAGVIGVMWK